MARKRTRLMTMFSLVAVLALAGMGLTYTLWSETLEIDGTVNTGSVDVKISGVATELVDQGTGPGAVPAGKEIADCSVIGSAGVAPQHVGDTVNTGDGVLTITVDGLYPSYYCIVEVTVTNIGTVPVHVNEPLLVNTTNANLVGLGSHDAYTTGECYDDDEQIHYNESVVCDIIIHFDNEDNLSEDSSYTFEFSIKAHQWNEAA